MKTAIKLITALLFLAPLQHQVCASANTTKSATPEIVNENLDVFGLNPKKRDYLLIPESDSETQQAEEIFTSWIRSNKSENYLKQFDQNKFHFQHVGFQQAGVKKMGILVIIPENEIEPEFYTTFGAGLEFPFQRCIESHVDWYNNGEIFSAVINLESESVEQFKNWRIEKAEDKNRAIEEYFAKLDITYAIDISEISMEIHHYLDDSLYDVISFDEFNQVSLPKQRKSSLVFYLNGKIKGIMCFDLKGIRYNCVMSYVTKVYLKERLGYGRILYSKLTCETYFDWKILNEVEFETFTSLTLAELSENFNDYISTRNSAE